jgi:hypothetical protein
VTKRKPLQWYGDEGGRLGYPACLECHEHMMQPYLVEAAASVGIEVGKSTSQMIREYIDDYHARRHKALA